MGLKMLHWLTNNICACQMQTVGRWTRLALHVMQAMTSKLLALAREASTHGAEAKPSTIGPPIKVLMP